MKRIGIAIPGWPDYTIDDEDIVRSYKRGKEKILAQEGNSDGNRRVNLERYVNGVKQHYVVGLGRLRYCVENNIDPWKMRNSGVIVINGKLATEEQRIDKIRKRMKELSMHQWPIGLSEHVYQRCRKFLDLQRTAQQTNNVDGLIVELVNNKKLIGSVLGSLYKISRYNLPVVDEIVRESITQHCERVVKCNQIFPDLISSVASRARRLLRYRDEERKLVYHRDNEFWNKRH